MTMHVPAALVVDGESDLAADAEISSKFEWVEPAVTVVVTVVVIFFVSLYSALSALL